MIKIIDRFLTKEEFDYVFSYCEQAPYHYGEIDKKDTLPTGMVHLVAQREIIYQLFESKTKCLFPDLILNEIYINCFAPSEKPYFHTDWENGVTCLYYPNQRWELDDGGETQFFIDDEIRGVCPIPNRLVYFDANILHKATTFRDRHRFTVAIKYGV